MLERVVPEAASDEHAAFRRAMLELRAQATHDDAYRDHFTRIDGVFRNHLAGLVRDGIEEGRYRDVDPEQVASMLMTIINGAILRRATTDDEVAMPAMRRELEAYLEMRLLAGDR